MTLKTYKCPNCGADIEVNADFDDATCNYCRTTFKLEEESTAKHVVNKITGIANKIIDTKAEEKRRAEEREAEEKRLAEENKGKNDLRFWLNMLAFMMIPVFCLLLYKLVQILGIG